MIEKSRIRLSQIFGVMLIAFICISSGQWEDKAPFLSAGLFFLGAIMVGIASIGRLWCLTYIAGYKADYLVTQGPYSMCRNPLYFFSLIGALGIGFATETLFIPLLIGIAFAIYYPYIIRSEEDELKRRHKIAFEKYMEKVPKFLPSISQITEPEEYVVKPNILKRHIFSALMFVWFIGIMEIIEELHELNILPTLLSIY